MPIDPGSTKARPPPSYVATNRGRYRHAPRGAATMTAMRFPLSLDVAGRRVVVVGGGPVGTRRAKALLTAGARVLLVDPRPSDEAQQLTGDLEIARRAFTADDVTDAWLVLACGGDAAVNAAVAEA